MKTFALILISVFAASASQQCEERPVHIVFQAPSELMADAFNLFVKTTNQDNAEDCWKIKEYNLVTTESEVVTKLGDMAPNIEANFVPGTPKRVILLAIANKINDPEALQDQAQILKELNCVFVIVAVNRTKEEKQTLKKISQKRVIDVEKYEEVQFFNTELLSLLRDPDEDVGLNDDEEEVLPGILQSYSLDDYETSETSKCWRDFDIGFIIDDSDSLASEYWKEKRFIAKLAKSFNISKEESRVSLIQFSYKAKLSIKLNKHTDVYSFADEVTNLKRLGHTTRIDLALQIARDKMFTVANGARLDKEKDGRYKYPKLLILVTDGRQTQAHGYTKPELIADEIRKMGIHLFVIGVGPNTDEQHLSRIAGPKDNYVKTMNFDELRRKKSVEKLARRACDSGSEVCETVVDICFLFDGSGSIDEQTDFKTMQEFAGRVANSFKISKYGARGGLIVFSDYIRSNRRYTRVETYLKDNETPKQFREAVESSKYIGYRTRIDLGFKLAEEKVFNEGKGARPDVKKIIILLTDGQQNPRRYDPVLASQKLFNDGVNIYAVGIGKYINHDQLVSITRDRSRVFTVDTFKALESPKFVGDVAKGLCERAPPS